MPVSTTETDSWMAKEVYAPGVRKKKKYKPYTPMKRTNLRSANPKNPMPKKHLPSLRHAYSTRSMRGMASR